MIKTITCHASIIRLDSLSSGMVFLVEFFYAITGYMRIDLRRGDIGMAEHHLNRPQVRAAFQKMAGEGMSKHMRRDLLLDTGPPCVITKTDEETLARHGPAFLAQKKRGAFSLL